MNIATTEKTPAGATLSLDYLQYDPSSISDQSIASEVLRSAGGRGNTAGDMMYMKLDDPNITMSAGWDTERGPSGYGNSTRQAGAEMSISFTGSYHC